MDLFINMKLFLLSIAVAFNYSSSLAQAPTTVCLGDNVNACQGQPLAINNCNNGTGGFFLNNPTPVILGDDNWSIPINIGFPFSYYGQNYTQLVAGSNGIASFNVGNAGNPCAWALNGTPFPTNAVLPTLNSAMICYQDLNPANATSGPVQAQTIGTAPSRKFILLYNGVTMFSCAQSCAYISMILYEGTNEIEYHIGYKGSCPTWNSGLAVQGVQNLNGTLASITPGRNNSQWNAVQDGRKWTPASATNTNSYTVTQIPYKNVSGSGGGLMWESTTGITYPYNGGVLNVNILPPGTTGFFLIGTSCGVSIGPVSDTTLVTRTRSLVASSALPAICGTNSGQVTAVPTQGTAPFTYTWAPGSLSGATQSNLSPGSYTVVMTDSNGCKSNSTVVISSQAPSFTSDSTVVNCNGGADGSATAYLTPSGAITAYSWNDPNNQSTQTAIGLPIGTYTCTITSDNGCTGSVSVAVTEPPSLNGQVVSKTDVSCYTKNNGQVNLSINGGTSPYTFSWSGSTQNSANVNDLYAGQQDVMVTDSKGCIINLIAHLSEPAPLSIIALTPDTSICPENSINLNVAGAGGSTSYTYKWFENNVLIGTGPSMFVNPSNDNTVYKAELSEACGSPVATKQLVINFPVPIDISFAPEEASLCAPDHFVFNNMSTPAGDVLSSYLLLGNGDELAVDGLNSVTFQVLKPGIYSMIVWTNSIYGCLYTDTLTNIINALERPEARFGMSSNPTTIFETKIAMQDKSKDAISWQWTVPAASPSSSTEQSPIVNFPSNVGMYEVSLKVSSNNGCTHSISKLLYVQNDLIFFAPNTFTPDGNAYNNTWNIITDGIDVSSYKMEIFDRWGTKLWESNEVQEGWDGTSKGKVLPSGTYSWKASFYAINESDKKHLDGTILLLE
jgi:gliding motility-associated-like protein